VSRHPINRNSRCPAKKMPGRVGARIRQRKISYARATAGNSVDRVKSTRFKASRRDAPVICPVCERRVDRQMRGQRYCSRRCRQRANYAAKVARGDFSTHTTALPTPPEKNKNKLKVLQRVKTLSSHRILAPERVLAVELFDRSWKPGISSGGVAVEVGRLRARALVPP
jgi:hypothetical protein